MRQRLIAGRIAALAALLLASPVQAIQLVDGPEQPALAGRVQLALESFKVLDAYPDKTFQGQRPITRYELADALWRAMSYLKTKYALHLEDDPRLGAVYQAYLRPGGDIPERHWAGPALQRVLGYGLMSAAQDLHFRGGDKVDRYLLAFTLNRLLGWLQVTPVKMASAEPRDLPADHWAAEAVRKLTEAGIFELDAEGNFSGAQASSRYELAESLVKLLQQVDLAAQQKPLEPQVTKPSLPRMPTGRDATDYR